jgi:integrase
MTALSNSCPTGVGMASYRKRLNKWQVRIHRLGNKPITKSFKNRADADRWARHIESQMDTGVYTDLSEAKRTTIADLIERYRQDVTPQKKGARDEQYRLNVIKRSRLACIALASARSTDIAKYRDTRIAIVSANTVKNELNTLSAMFEYAKGELGLVANNPVRSVKRPAPPRGRTRRLMPGEEESLFAACRSSRAWYLIHLVTLAIETGARLGELTQLRWENIDLTKGVAHLLDTKNGEDRSIPLSQAAVQSLKTMPRGFNGRLIPASTDSVKETFRSAVKRGGLIDFHFHDLRHEAISRFFERGLNAIEVSAISGHKTLQMLKRYTHLRAEDLAKKLG